MSWQPDPTSLNQLIDLLIKAQSPDSNVQMMVYNQLQSFNAIPDFNNYLIYIFATPNLPQSNIYMRNQSGLYLKNNIINSNSNITPDTIAHAKEASIQTLIDKDKMIRLTSGTLISTIINIYGLESWPEILPSLDKLLDHPETYVVEASINAIEKICEDNTRQLNEDTNKPLFYMIPKIIKLFENPSAKVRRDAIKCINHFITTNSEALNANINNYVQGLYQRTSDTDPEVRKYLCQSIVNILDAYPNQLIPEFENVVNFMLYCTNDEDESVALEACEFWLVFAEKYELSQYIEPYLPKIVQILLKSMVYNEEEIEMLDQDDNNQDTDQDIKPMHHKSKNAHGMGEEKDDEDEDDDDDDDEYAYEWNLRKCAAYTLDEFSSLYSNNLLEILLPPLQEKLNSQDWKDNECAILALGAIAEGCGESMEPYLPEMMKFLIQNLNNPKPLVRSITCWTISRYCQWGMNYQEGGNKIFFVPIVEGILNTLLDSSKRVQEASCSALITLIEESNGDIIQFMNPIIEKLGQAFNIYQSRNLLILYNAIGTLAESFGEAINTQEFVNLIMQPLVKRWSMLNDDDHDLFPLLECISYIAIGMGQGFLPFADQIWKRCLTLIETTIHMAEASANGIIDDYVDKDFIVVSLDLLSGIIQGLGASASQVIEPTLDAFLSIELYCLKDSMADVQQSAYALLGDLAINVFQYIKPYLNEIFTDVVNETIPNEERLALSSSVYNNAIWATGEIALKNGAETSPYVSKLLENFIPLIQAVYTPNNLKENLAITIGRLGLVCHDIVAPLLQHFFIPWCAALRNTADNEEKISAFLGMCNLIQANPNAVSNDFVYFCDAVTQFNNISPELNEKIKEILYGLKQMYGNQWDAMLSSLGNPDVEQIMRRRLMERYQI
ncbi:ARM repeat-containing protein [Neocallimastix californiae]|uniref:ARM repeat-containing protein n=1 Tax=Neocallimastix californiae TaxID=1754190 RepID=A0A1Y2ACI1_9FUNG|nr:ARM repeat-containing protein [Neocallimastix californiae]|eukprot:ORY20216.1 ARM repeat-containing protein [Neocallimastix californiae]